MNILVTGGAGFIGSELVAALRKKDHAVSVFSRRTGGDITNRESLRRALKNQDAVFHLAALNSQLAPYDKLYKANAVGTENVMQASIAAGVEKVIYASTTAFSTSKVTAYGITKKYAEEAVKERWGEIDAPMLRYPMVYDEPNIRRMMRFGNFPMTTKKNTWHLCYRKSLISAYISALEKGKSEIYTVADEKPVESHELYDTFMRAQGYKPFYVPHALIAPFFYATHLLKPIKMLGLKVPTPELFNTIFQDRVFEPTKKLKYEQADTLETFRKLITGVHT